MKTLLIVEDALVDLNGHWFEQIYAVDKASKNNNWQVVVACNKSAHAHVRDTLKTYPIFKCSYYLDFSRPMNGIKRMLFLLKYYFNSVSGILKLLRRHSLDLIFLPTATVHHLFIWSLILLIKPSISLKLLFLTPPGFWSEQTKKIVFPKSAVVFKYLSKFVTKFRNVELSVQTRIAQTELINFTKVNFKLYPQPVDTKSKNVLHQQKSDKVTFGSLGYERYEKGSDVLICGIELFLNKSDNEKVCFKLQWKDCFVNTENRKVCFPEKFINNSKITRIYHNLNTEEYLSELLSVDCVILPYRNSSYYFRDSRVAIEAGIYGIPMIYTKGGWLEEFVEEFGAGIGIDEGDEKQLAEAINEMITNYLTIKELAEKNRVKTSKYYSSDNFFSQLIN